jgi:hypothetical protein
MPLFNPLKTTDSLLEKFPVVGPITIYPKPLVNRVAYIQSFSSSSKNCQGVAAPVLNHIHQEHGLNSKDQWFLHVGNVVLIVASTKLNRYNPHIFKR